MSVLPKSKKVNIRKEVCPNVSVIPASGSFSHLFLALLRKLYPLRKEVKYSLSGSQSITKVYIDYRCMLMYFLQM